MYDEYFVAAATAIQKLISECEKLYYFDLCIKKSLNLHVHKCYSSKPFTVIVKNHGMRLENGDAVITDFT